MSTSFQSPNPTSTAPVTDIETQIVSSSTTEQSFGNPDSSSTNDVNTLNQIGSGSTSNTGSQAAGGIINSIDDGINRQEIPLDKFHQHIYDTTAFKRNYA